MKDENMIIGNKASLFICVDCLLLISMSGWKLGIYQQLFYSLYITPLFLFLIFHPTISPILPLVSAS